MVAAMVEHSGTGMGKGRDGTVSRFFVSVSRKFVPVPLVPKSSAPVLVSRDTKIVGTDRDSRPTGQSRKSRHTLVE